MKYKLQENGVSIPEKNMNIPSCEGNKDWREYQAWLKEGNKPDPEFTKEELAAKKAVKYKEDRRQSYASVNDQLDMQYHDKTKGTATWIDHVRSVKEKYPKP